jgi:epoxyqueuosine reductase
MDAGIESRIKAHGAELGFSLVGITRPSGSAHGAFYREWLARGAHGEMGYLARPAAVARREDLRGTMEAVGSVVVVAHEYFTPDAPGDPDDPSVGVIARYARGRDYHRVLKKKLVGLLEWLRESEGVAVEGRAYVDTGPILERELAARAGLGWFGRNTMLIHPRRGSWFFLGCLLIDLELEPDAPFAEDHCGTCRRCVDACPTGALLGRDETGAPVIDARRCISYLTIENRGPIPRELRPLMGNRIYGCDICQEVCPWNSPKMVRITTERDYRPDWREAKDRPRVPRRLPGTRAPSLVELMRLTHEEWDHWTRGSAIRRAGYAGFKRNVAVAMGNWLGSVGEPPEEAMSVLRDALEDEEPLVREHATWALERARRYGTGE